MTTLSFEQIKKLVHGAAFVEEGDGKISFFRFTKEQQELYRVTSTDFYIKSMATAGISLEFDTDSENLALSFIINRGSSRTYFTISVFAAGRRIGELSGNIGGDENVPCRGSFALGEGVKKVRIQLPWSVAASLTSLELDDGAIAVPVHKKRKMLIFGDSITQGYDASRPEYAYAVRLADFLSARAVNKSIAGEQFFSRLSELSDDFEPELITVAYGTNDWRHSNKEKFERECAAFFENLTNNYPTAKIFALTPLWRVDMDTDYGFGEAFPYVARYIKQVAKKYPNVSVVDGIDLVPHRPSHYQTDGVHPIDSGFEHFTNNLCSNKHFRSIAGK